MLRDIFPVVVDAACSSKVVPLGIIIKASAEELASLERHFYSKQYPYFSLRHPEERSIIYKHGESSNLDFVEVRYLNTKTTALGGSFASLSIVAHDRTRSVFALVTWELLESRPGC
ncbi:hypothetical protein E4U32_004167 [Claviceps aff. humidiphila group G2b]|nr:hypothetical protein E4U32_004167 [Claviceps aff. humidiphila group G2b]